MRYLFILLLSMSMSYRVDAGPLQRLPKYTICNLLFVTTMTAAVVGSIKYRFDEERREDLKFKTTSLTMRVRDNVSNAIRRRVIDLSSGDTFVPGPVEDLDQDTLDLIMMRNRKDSYGTSLQLRRVWYKHGNQEPQKGFLVLSAGPDHAYGTKDDIGFGEPITMASDPRSYMYILEKDEWKQMDDVITFD